MSHRNQVYGRMDPAYLVGQDGMRWRYTPLQYHHLAETNVA
jgi:hypothetical protein